MVAPVSENIGSRASFCASQTELSDLPSAGRDSLLPDSKTVADCNSDACLRSIRAGDDHPCHSILHCLRRWEAATRFARLGTLRSHAPLVRIPASEVSPVTSFSADDVVHHAIPCSP